MIRCPRGKRDRNESVDGPTGANGTTMAGTSGTVSPNSSRGWATAGCIFREDHLVVAAAAPGRVLCADVAQMTLASIDVPHTTLSPSVAVPQTMLSPSDAVPQMTLSQSAPPQSVPHDDVVAVRLVPQTMLSPSDDVPQTTLSPSPPCPRRRCRRHPPSCPTRCCRRSSQRLGHAPDDVVAPRVRGRRDHAARQAMVAPDDLAAPHRLRRHAVARARFR